MKNLITTSLLIFILTVAFGQENEFIHGQTMRIINKEGADIKAEPDISSKSLVSLPFWSEVLTIYIKGNHVFHDTINNVPGSWKRASYLNTVGYLFDGFGVEVDTNVNRDKKIRIMLEGGQCAFPNYDPSLYWYGIYRTGKTDSLIRVEINIGKRLTIENERFYLTTNRSEKQIARFLIGSSVPMTDEVANYFVQIDESYPYLYPGQLKNILYQDGSKNSYGINDFDLYATGAVNKLELFYPLIENYGLKLSNKRVIYTNKDAEKPLLNQDISDSFGGFWSDVFPRIYWYGDLDNDLKPDIIFLTWDGTSATKYTLFLSSYADEGEFVKKVDRWISNNCN